jgi:hypothetical protein
MLTRGFLGIWDHCFAHSATNAFVDNVSREDAWAIGLIESGNSP